MLPMQKNDNMVELSPSVDTEGSANGSPASASKLTPSRVMLYDSKDSRRNSVSRKDTVSALNSFPERTQAGDLFSGTVRGHHIPPVRSQLFMNNVSGKKYMCLESESYGNIELNDYLADWEYSYRSNGSSS